MWARCLFSVELKDVYYVYFFGENNRKKKFEYFCASFVKKKILWNALTRRSLESTHLTSLRPMPALGLSSVGSDLISKFSPAASSAIQRLFHLLRCSDRFSIHRPARRGPNAAAALAVVAASSPYVSPPVAGLPVARFIPGDRGGGYEGTRGGASFSSRSSLVAEGSSPRRGAQSAIPGTVAFRARAVGKCFLAGTYRQSWHSTAMIPLWQKIFMKL